MIRRVLAVNFRSLGSVELDVGRLTALVGPNGAGKSNVLDVLRFLSEAVRHGLETAVAERQGFGSLQRWSRGGPRKVDLAVSVKHDGEEYSWELALANDARADFRVQYEKAVFDKYLSFELKGGMLVYASLPFLPSIEPALQAAWLPALPQIAKISVDFQPLVDELSRVAVYSLFPPTLRLPQNPDSTRPMRRHGENWASTLRALDRDREGAELLAALGRIVGDIDDYRVTAVGGFLIPEFRHGTHNGRERWFGAAQESDGTLRVAALLTALLQSPPPSVIGIEEPELAVHPGALPILVDYLKEASKRTQVIITTHSPELLDLLPPESLRVVERVDGATTVRELASDQKELLRKQLYSTSELLRTEGLRGEEAETPVRNDGDASQGEVGDGQGLPRRRGPRRRRGGAEPHQPAMV